MCRISRKQSDIFFDKPGKLNSTRLKTKVRPSIRVWFACVATRNAFEVAVEKFLHVHAVRYDSNEIGIVLQDLAQL